VHALRDGVRERAEVVKGGVVIQLQRLLVAKPRAAGDDGVDVERERWHLESSLRAVRRATKRGRRCARAFHPN
jgi:hypothetical protein